MADPKQPPNASEVQHAAGRSAAPRWLTALSATDITIRRFNLLISTVDGQESVLSTVEYFSSILHHLSKSAPWIALQLRLLTRVKTRTTLRQGNMKSFSTKFESLSALASETRCNLRLFGLLQLWTWGSETFRSPPADSLIYALTMLQVVSNMIYQLLENTAYLASKGIVSRRLVNKYGGIEKWYLWSTRGWFGHIFLQFLVLWRQRILYTHHMPTPATGVVDSKTMRIEEAEKTRIWRKSLVNNILWAPLCIHWCLEDGMGIPENLTGLVSVLAGAWGLRDSWAETADA